MRTLHAERDLTEILNRLSALTHESRPRWGRMDVGRMLCHLADATRMSLGELKTVSKGKRVFQVFPLKHLILYVLPFPKGAPTAPELLSTRPADFLADRQRVRELVERFSSGNREGTGPEHPLLGPLSRGEWAFLQYKHMDHHLSQFGV